MESFKKLVSKIVSAKDLDYELTKDIEYGHTLLSVVPTSMELITYGEGCDPGNYRVTTYKIIYLDCRYRG